MTSLVSGAEPGFEPIEGYILRERIGAGGYGEVWLADAPGGLQKAIKFVFGSIDERAGNELRSLQRIRAVHHPFILSLERIEILKNQLMVVTELADGSLLDRFNEFHQRGLIGIPRTRLLEYLRDTADALDFLCQKHDLQHLDVKPANLLLVADRVKVADFGLIKDIQNRSMSIMSGMTPTYAAPEMFDGRPGRFSDQYSLAIVYQELLTGTLPFSGRTTAQLAAEHLHKAPMLDSLPALERPIVAKALSKKPSQRFSSCKEFVDQLFRIQALSDNQPIGHSPPDHQEAELSIRHSPRPSRAVQKSDGNATVSWSGNSSSAFQRQAIDLPAVQLPEAATGALAPSIFIGVGGTGAEVLTTLRSRLQASGLDLRQLLDVGWIQADTDEATLQRATDPMTTGRLSLDDTLLMPLRTAQQYRNRPQEAFTPLSRRWLYNVPRSQATEGVRPMGMLAFLDYSTMAYDLLKAHLSTIVQQQCEFDGEKKPIRIYLAGSVHGGTGSVLAIELAFLIRRIATELNANIRVQAVLCVGEQSDFASTELASAAGVACLQELGHYFRTNGLHPGVPGIPEDHASNPPWNQVYLVHGGPLGKQAAWRSAVEQMTDFLCIDACTALGEVLDECRDETIACAANELNHEWNAWLRMFASRRLDLSAQLHPEKLAKHLTLQFLHEWLSALDNAQSKPPSSQALPADENAAVKLRAANQQIELFVSDLFREMQWSAQSWVRHCMEQLLQRENVAKSSMPTDVAPEQASGIESAIEQIEKFEQIEKLELDQLSDTLGISLHHSQRAAQSIIDDAIRGLMARLKSGWLQSISNWSQLRDVLACISNRFASQSQSLLNVAIRIKQDRESMLNSLFESHARNGASDPSPDKQQEIVQQIEAFKAQASIHQLASRLLARLGQYVTHLSNVWQTESAMAVEEFLHWTRSLAHELDVSIDAEGRIRDSWLPLPATWFAVRNTTQMSVDQALQSLVRQRFFDSLTTSQITSTPPTESRRFDEFRLTKLIELVSGVAQQSAIEAGLIQCTSDDSQSTTTQTAPATPGNFQLDRQMLMDQLQADDMKLLASGGAKRTLLLLPSGVIDDDTLQQWRNSLDQNITIAELDGLKSAILCVDGEQLDLSQIVHRLWLPGRDRCQLAERLHSRNDVEWLPIE
jgi:serine/threonine protein kinase